MSERTITRTTVRPGDVAGMSLGMPRVPAAILWRRWVLANVAGEVVGFGLAVVAGVGVAALV